MEPPRQTAEMASVPRLERCPPGPTSLSRTPSGALVTVECGETPWRGGACRRLCAGVLAAPGCSQQDVGRDALGGPAPHLHMVSCGPLPNSLSADATMLATQALVQRLLMDSDHQPELRPWAPQNVSGQRGAGSLPGQGGERAHKDSHGTQTGKGPASGDWLQRHRSSTRGTTTQPREQSEGIPRRFSGWDPVLPLLGLGLIPGGELRFYRRQGGTSSRSHVAREMPSTLLNNVPSRTYSTLLLKLKLKKKKKGNDGECIFTHRIPPQGHRRGRSKWLGAGRRGGRSLCSLPCVLCFEGCDWITVTEIKIQEERRNKSCL